MNDLFVVLKA